jgi:starch synthase
MPPIKLCVLSSEIMPYAKTGGLADVVGALIPELQRLGHQVRAFMPLYAPVRGTHPEIQPVDGLQHMSVTLGAESYAFSMSSATFPGTDAVCTSSTVRECSTGRRSTPLMPMNTVDSCC